MFVRHDANLPLLQSLNPALFAEVTKPVQPEDMLRRNKFSTANEHLIKEALLRGNSSRLILVVQQEVFTKDPGF
jgi:hypothetical protein